MNTLCVEAITCLQNFFFPNLYQNGKSISIDELLALSQIAFNLELSLKNIECASCEGQQQEGSPDFGEFLKRKIAVSFIKFLHLQNSQG